MNAMIKYYDMCLKDDVLLLAYMFEFFRKEVINSFELDFPKYLSAPGYIWGAMQGLQIFN